MNDFGLRIVELTPLCPLLVRGELKGGLDYVNYE
jgi:hypothetical protein